MRENDNDFEMLRRLLTLKRHEIPPPGYFNRFSGEVIGRIRAGNTSKSSSNWLASWFQVFEIKPAFAGTFAGALCLLLVFGIVLAQQPDSTPQPFLQSVAQNVAVTPQLAALSPTIVSEPVVPNGIIASTNPVFNIQPVASLFGQQNPLVMPASFSPSGN